MRPTIALIFVALLAGCAAAPHAPAQAKNKRAADSICRGNDPACIRLTASQWEQVRDENERIPNPEAP